jgi:DNA-binding transcriptional LysR family regulator
MELRHLRYFVAVAEELSFTRAAQGLGIAQPPLSQQIRYLERELGFTLFDRDQRPLQLTPAGQAFLEGARQVLQQLEQTVQTAKMCAQGEQGQLSVGFTSTIAHSILATILRAFQDAYPSVKLLLQEEDQASQWQNLRDRKTDISFLYQFQPPTLGPQDEAPQPLLDDPTFEWLCLQQESLMVILPIDHPLTPQRTIHLSQLASEKFIIPPRFNPSGLTAQIYHLCTTAGFTPNVIHEAIGVTALGLVASGLGVSILPQAMAHLQRPDIAFRPLQEGDAIAQLVALWRRENRSTVLQHFVAMVQRQIETASLTIGS